MLKLTGSFVAAVAAAGALASSDTHNGQFNWTLLADEFDKAGQQSTVDGSVSFLAVANYSGPVNYGNYSINAPINCQGQNTHMGCFAWFDGIFDASRCGTLCQAKPGCRYFNTYMIQQNGVDYAQYCSMYTQTWGSAVATNSGQFDSAGNNYTIYNSQGYNNASDPGPCQDGFSCDANGYLIQNVTLYSVNLGTGNLTQVNASVGGGQYSLNAMGYNSVDNYLYAARFTNPVTLVKLSNTGNMTTVENLPFGNGNTPANPFAGDVDEQGHYWAYSYINDQFLEVDLNPGPTYGNIITNGTAPVGPGIRVIDFAYVPGAGNYLYGFGYNSTANGATNSARMYRFDRAAYTWSLVKDFGNVVNGSAGNRFGATYATASGLLYATENTSGNIYKFTQPFNASVPVLSAQAPETSNNDGARCIKV
ncbi:hypothetical protein F4780DRAFT_786467 [Xylariomycetidae sp. FL0641]|nr:hypothetical protein F4780DRAFT_786467 [Xylariomycetidae sp. FL0641]